MVATVTTFSLQHTSLWHCCWRYFEYCSGWLNCICDVLHNPVKVTDDIELLSNIQHLLHRWPNGCMCLKFHQTLNEFVDLANIMKSIFDLTIRCVTHHNEPSQIVRLPTLSRALGLHPHIWDCNCQGNWTHCYRKYLILCPENHTMPYSQQLNGH